MWSVVMWSELMWFVWSDFVLNLSKMMWVTVKYLGTKVPYTLGCPYTEGTWLYCGYLIRRIYCTAFVLICGVMCGCVMCEFCNVCVFWQFCGFFCNTCACIYCVLYCLYCVFVFIVYVDLFSFVCTSVRTTATEWKLNCSNYYYYYY
jgi:hypothetical protein